MRWTRTTSAAAWRSATALAWAALLGSVAGLIACRDDDGGLSIQVACDVYAGRVVECLSDNPDNDDNVETAAIADCEDRIAAWQRANPDDDDCDQAVRRWHQCMGAEWACADLRLQDTTKACPEATDEVADRCDNIVQG